MLLDLDVGFAILAAFLGVVEFFMHVNEHYRFHIEALSQALKAHCLWPSIRPPETAFLSTTPFAVDTMAFESWLAFIFIPKMETLIARNAPLPPMEIAPAAEVYLSPCPLPIMTIIKKLDALSMEQANAF
jgi:uncharacterized protein YqcC (DUF446 family)